MSKRRATIARRLVEAQHNAAMLTTFNEVDMSLVMALRERQKEAFKKSFGVGLGIASFFVKASIAALREFPALNAEIQGDEIVYKHYYDIGMAVGAEGGLVVPVLRDAERMTFPQIEKAIRDYAGQGQRRHAHARGSARRHVHDHQRRRLRIADEHAHSEPAAGSDSRPAQDSGSRRAGQRPALSSAR
jgi:pyruvate/2-oxoglutarate dehydrogenase complex dihydrolipoamide acyltransferase (E2) component